MLIPHRKPITVGRCLREDYIEPLGLTQTQLAAAMGVSRVTVSELCLDKRSVTRETATLLAAALGTTPEFWLNLQHLTELWELKNSKALRDRATKVTRLAPDLAA